MKNEVRIFISYCGVDKPKKDALKAHLLLLAENYAKTGISLEICEMETHCAGEWDKWMIGAIKASDVVISILEDSLFTEEKAGKRLLEELRTARDENKGIVPLILTERELPDEYKAHIGRLSQVWYTYENGDEEVAYKQAAEKAKLLLDGVIKGEKVDQGDSVRILSGVASKNEKFVGRRAEMEWLRKNLTESNVVVLHGEGGIGKTSLAENFFYQSPDLFDRAYVISATGGIRKGICGIEFESTRHIAKEEERYKENYRLLSSLSEKTMIVFDNCDEGVDADELAQLAGQTKCRFVITSRVGSEDFPYALEVRKMSDEELFALVYKHYPNIVGENGGNQAEVEKLLREFFRAVDGHTMTVEMAAAIMRDGDISVEKVYEAILKCNQKCKPRRNKGRKASPSDHLAVLYDFANVSEREERILSAVCLIEPTVGIPRRDLSELLELEDNNEINELVEKTFLRMQERVISMHPLFSDVFYRLKNVSEKEEQNGKVVIYLLDIVVEINNLKGYERKVLLLNYLIEKRRDMFTSQEHQVDLAYTYYICANCLRLTIHYSKAKEYYLEAIRLYETIFADDLNRDELADCYNGAGLAYSDLGQPKKALEYHRKALKIRETVHAEDPNHEDILSSYNNIACTYGELGEYKKALEYHEKVLKIREEFYANEPNGSLALSYNNIGGAYADLEEYEKALECYQKALAIYESLYAETNPDHVDLAMIYDNMGGIYSRLGDHEKALKYHRKALEIRETLYAEDYPNHDELELSYANFGYELTCFGEYEEALIYKKKALKIRAALSAGEPNEGLARRYYSVAKTYTDINDHENALEYYLKTAEVEEALYANDPNNSKLAITYNRIGLAYSKLDKDKKALEYYLKGLRIREVVYADRAHEDLAISYYNVAVKYEQFGENERALAYYQKALKIWEAVYADEPQNGIFEKVWGDIARVSEKLGK